MTVGRLLREGLLHYELAVAQKIVENSWKILRPSISEVLRQQQFHSAGALLGRDGRLTEAEVFARLDRGREVPFTGPRGTLIAEDTRGLHKGCTVVAGHGLIFQVEYAINLFGYPYPPIRLTGAFSPAFRELVRRYPYAFANYVEAG